VGERGVDDGVGEDGYDPATLYSKIGSNQEKAFAADARL
jgi:hypothetical protein